MAPLLVAVLILDLPLALLYGLRAELRHISSLIPGSRTEVVSQAYSVNSLLPTLAINNGPEDAVSPRSVDLPRCNACPMASVAFILAPRPTARYWNRVSYVDDEFIRPLPRSYDPLGPPPAHL